LISIFTVYLMLNTSYSFAKKACDNATSLLVMHRSHADCFFILLFLLEIQVILMWNLTSVQLSDA